MTTTGRPCERVRIVPTGLLLLVCVAGCAAVAPNARGNGRHAIDRDTAPSDMLTTQSLDPDIPQPQMVLGHAIGDGAVKYGPARRYAQALVDVSERVTWTSYAESHEGRTLFYLTITSPANHARLPQIMEDNARLADTRELNEAQADQIIRDLPGIAWMSYSIHGDELSSTDAALLLAYQLTAGTDDRTRRMLDQMVIHIDPMMNPDGRERYLDQLQHLTGKVPNPDYQAMQHRGLWSAGRGNHYLFDLNRDWLMQVHPETRGRAREILRWHPHLLVDSHEMGSLDTYLFDPPREPLNLEMSARNMAWRLRFSADQAAAFDSHGWSYYTEEWYEEWYPGYTNSWANLLGTVALLYEQAGVNATSVKQRTGQELTYREAVHHQFVSSLANLDTLYNHRADILKDKYRDRRDSVRRADSSVRALLVPPQPDRSRVGRLFELLDRHGIEVQVAADDFRATAVESVMQPEGRTEKQLTLPKGTRLVRVDQPQQRLLKAMLDFDPHMTEDFLKEERTELERRRGSRLYDTTAWNLAMAYGVEAYWADISPDVAVGEPEAPAVPPLPEAPDYGYVIDGATDDAVIAISRLLSAGCHVRVARKPFAVHGRSHVRGSVLLRRHEQPQDYLQQLQASRAGLDIDVFGADTALTEAGPDLGGREFPLLTLPRVAIASQWPVSTGSFGALWHLLDARVGMRCSPVSVQRLPFVDLRRYNVLILPNAGGSLAGVLTEDARSRLRDWIEDGGTLIAVGGAAAFAAGLKNNLSQVRARRDVLDKVKVYAENVARERQAQRVDIDPDLIWSNKTLEDVAKEKNKLQPGQAAVNQLKENLKKNGKKTPPKSDKDAAKRLDDWQRLFSPRGVFAAADLDVEHWLCFGLGERMPVYLSTRTAFLSQYPVATPARLAPANGVRLSGLMWPEARQRWADSAYATVERLGRGQIVLFVSDPAFRGFLEGTQRMLLNAVIMGPGMGTSQPVPW